MRNRRLSRWLLATIPLAVLPIGLTERAAAAVPATPVINYVEVMPGQTTIDVGFDAIDPAAGLDPADSHQFWVRPVGGTWAEVDWVAASASTNHKLLATTLVAGATYEVRMHNRDWPGGGTNSAFSPTVAVKMNAAPTGLTTVSSAESITVNWVSYGATPVHQYDLYLGTNATNMHWVSSVGGPATSSYTFDGLDPDTTYQVGVQVIQNAGTQDPGNSTLWENRARTSIASTTGSTQKLRLDAPRLVSATALVDQRTVEVVWEHTGQALHSYEILWRNHVLTPWTDTSGSWVSGTDGGVDASYVGLTGQTTYTERLKMPVGLDQVDLAVRAVPVQGATSGCIQIPYICSDLNVADFGVSLKAPVAPSISDLAANSARLNWTYAGTTPFTYWEFFQAVGTSLGANPSPVAQRTGLAPTSNPFTGLTAGTQYTFGVRARQSLGNPGANEPPVVTAIAASTSTTSAASGLLPPKITAAVINTDQRTVDVTFNSVAGAGEYQLQWRHVGQSTWQWVSCGGAGPNTGGASPKCSWVTGTGTGLVRSLTMPVGTSPTGVAAGSQVELSIMAVPIVNGVATCASTPACSVQNANAFPVTLKVPTITTTPAIADQIQMNWSAYASVPWANFDYSIVQGTGTPISVATSTNMAATSYTFGGLTAATSYKVGITAIQSPLSATRPKVSTTMAVAQQSTIAATGWTTQWTDNFNYASNTDPAFTSNWSMQSGGGEGRYAGQDCARTENVTFVTDPQNSNNKLLRLVNKKAVNVCGGATFNYSHGSIRSKLSTARPGNHYGRWDFHMKIPAGQGLFSGAWLTDDGGYINGEIDVIENPGYDPTHLRSTVHWGNKNAAGTAYVEASAPSRKTGMRTATYIGDAVTPGQPNYGNITTEFITYRVEVTPCRIAFYIKGANTNNQWVLTNNTSGMSADGKLADWSDTSKFTGSQTATPAAFPAPFSPNGQFDTEPGGDKGWDAILRLTGGFESGSFQPGNAAGPTTPALTNLDIDWVGYSSQPSYQIPAGCNDLVNP